MGRRLNALVSDRSSADSAQMIEQLRSTGHDTAADLLEALEVLLPQAARHEDLLHSLDAIVWEADADTFEFSFVSEGAERILGFPVERWLTESNFWADQIHPHDRERTVNECRRATDRGDDHEFEYRAIAADGRVVWIRDIVRYLPATEDRPATLHGVMVDVTYRRQAEERARFRAQLLDQVAAAVVAVDLEGRVTQWNSFAEDLFGWSRAETIGRDIRDLNVLAADSLLVDNKMEVLRDGRTWDGEMTMRRKDGSTFPAYSRDAPVYDSRGELAGFVGNVVDIEERKQWVTDLADSERRFRRLVEHSPDGILLCDGDCRIIDANEAAAAAVGRTRDEMSGMSLKDIDHELSGAELDKLKERAALGRPVTYESVHRRRDGSSFPVEIRLTLFESGDQQLYLSFVRDISERRRAEVQSQYLAHHDEFTGLPNRALFREHLELAMSRARRTEQALAVVHVDLDGVELVDGSLGPAARDELVRQAADRLAECTRTVDLVARQGLGEFLILVADLESEGDESNSAEDVARSVHEALERPFTLRHEEEVVLGVTVGITLFPGDARDADELLDRPADEEGSHSRLSLGTRLRKAVGDKQFVLHYQPVVDLQKACANRVRGPASLNGEVVGVEALLRWEDPARGLIPPLEFIGAAEEAGLIDQIGDWVLEEVCGQMREWDASGIDYNVGLNVSPRQLRRPRFAQKMVADVESAGVDPSKLVVEVTESLAMMDPVRAREILEELREQGFVVAIDDFGAGHSSLAHLSQMPVRMLKIDRSVVGRLPGDEPTATMVTAMIQLAENLGMVAQAEGIETSQQLEFLASRGCALGQGYLFSRPVPASELPGVGSRG